LMSHEDYMKQMEEMIQHIRGELTTNGFAELRTPEEVESFFAATKGTALLVVNSICGCAGKVARPAIVDAVKQPAAPGQLVTVFAGQDKEATAQARTHIPGYPPSSPSIALFKDGELVKFWERSDIEGFNSKIVGESLKEAFAQYCQ
jgi:putative YphP/YqiW family bacilliredoxin